MIIIGVGSTKKNVDNIDTNTGRFPKEKQQDIYAKAKDMCHLMYTDKLDNSCLLFWTKTTNKQKSMKNKRWSDIHSDANCFQNKKREWYLLGESSTSRENNKT